MVLLTKVLWMLRSEDWIIKKESDYNKQVSHRKLSRLVTPLWGGEELFLLRRRPNFYLEFEIDPTSGPLDPIFCLLLGVDHKPRPYRRSKKDIPYPCAHRCPLQRLRCAQTGFCPPGRANIAASLSCAHVERRSTGALRRLRRYLWPYNRLSAPCVPALV